MSDDPARTFAEHMDEPPDKVIAHFKSMLAEPARLAEYLAGLVPSGHAPDAKMDAIRDAGTAMLNAEIARSNAAAVFALKAEVEKLNRSTSRLACIAICVGLVGVLLTAAQVFGWRQ